jgi:hypothetical protein
MLAHPEGFEPPAFSSVGFDLASGEPVRADRDAQIPLEAAGSDRRGTGLAGSSASHNGSHGPARIPSRRYAGARVQQGQDVGPPTQ